jgi:hypothetical protein
VLDGLQAQGDLVIIPLALVRTVQVHPWVVWRPVPPEGVELLRGETGNTHTLVADVDTCRWTAGLRDPLDLTVRLFENTAPAYLIHPEHGAGGVAPGRWLVRRQQEYGSWRRLAAD